MASLTLDLTGKGGLAPRFWGDIDRTTAVQNLRYLGGDNQMADGIYNPMRRYGYLSPSNAVFNAVTDGTTENFSSIMSCSIYDAVNDDYYYGRYSVGLIYKGDGLDDIALATQAIPSATFATDNTLFDLEVYQVNGVRKLFYVYKTSSPAGVILTNSYTGSALWRVRTAVVKPFASTLPTVTASGSDYQDGAATTQTYTFTVPASTNRTLIVFAYTNNSTTSTHATVTWNGGAMTERAANTSNIGGGIFALANPTSGAHDIVVTWPASYTSRLIHAVVVDNSDQDVSTMSVSIPTGTSSIASTGSLSPVNSTYLTLMSSMTNQVVTQSNGSLQTAILSNSNAASSDSLSKMIPSGSYLKVGIATLPFASADDYWLTATVSGAFMNNTTGHAFMENSDNGLSYLFQDNVVHKIDGTAAGGTNGTISANVLTFPTHYRCVDAVDYRGIMFIGIHKYSPDIRSADDTIDTNTLEVGVYLWDRNVSVTSIRDIIPLGGVKQLRRLYVAPNGKVRAMVINSERVVEIREYNGSTFESVQEVGYNSYPAFRDSVATFSGMTTWLGRNGIIYSHGAVISGDKDALYKIGTLTDMSTAAVSAGAILYGGEDVGSTSAGYKTQKSGLFLSYYNGTNNKVKEWDIYGTGSTGSTVVAKTSAQGDIYTLVKYLPQMSTVKDIEIFMVPGSGSGSTTAAAIKIYFNQSTTAWASKVVTADDCAKGYKRIEINKPFVNAVQLEIEYPSATIGTLDFAPSVAIVEYEPTNTKG